jgi:colanic acid/amylovoran biosynthesis protein
MKIVIINCHWDNRGDEAAIRAMIDELQLKYPEVMIYVQKALGEFTHFPENERVKVLPAFPVGGKKRTVFEWITEKTNGKVNFTRGAREFYNTLSGCDLVLHAPGGPSIGDIYLQQEKTKLRRLKMVKNFGAPYAFYAPSMGPFKNVHRNPLRKEILENAEFICLREDVSAGMLQEFIPEIKPIVTLDSAFQHDIDIEISQNKLLDYNELNKFIGDGSSVIGITITDLQWNSLYRDDGVTKEKIREVFSNFISYITNNGYKVLFIPQLFDGGNDYRYMSSFENEMCYTMADDYDCYFQQYIISKIKAVVGMRYHSNIFSAKMGTPFISISYEQKMLGFMKKAGLMDNCIVIGDLDTDSLIEKFENLINNYDYSKHDLMNKKDMFKKESGLTTEIVCEYLESNKK